MNLDKAESIIKQFEGCELTAYKDLKNIWTIGYGHTGKDVVSGMKITQEQADTLLEHNMYLTLAMLDHIVPSIEMKSENKSNALVSFVYNIGIGQFQESTMLKMIRAGDLDSDVAMQFDRWVFCDGKVVDGLYRRRMAEKALFLLR